MPPPIQARSKRWCFTEHSDNKWWETDVFLALVTYVRVNKEATTEGRIHFQGWCSFIAPMRMTGLKKVNNTAHWEKIKGSVRDNEHYCLKPAEGCVCANCETERENRQQFTTSNNVQWTAYNYVHGLCPADNNAEKAIVLAGNKFNRFHLYTEFNINDIWLLPDDFLSN